MRSMSLNTTDATLCTKAQTDWNESDFRIVLVQTP